MKNKKEFFTEITEEQIENGSHYKEMYEEYQRILNEEETQEYDGSEIKFKDIKGDKQWLLI